MQYAYCRVSCINQNLERQLTEMRKLDIDERNIYTDKQSGKDFDRGNWKSFMRKIKSGELLVKNNE